MSTIKETLNPQHTGFNDTSDSNQTKFNQILDTQSTELNQRLDTQSTIQLDEIIKDYYLDSKLALVEISLSDDEKSRILTKTLEKSGLQGSKISRPKLRLLLVACILILATFTLSFAAYQYMASDKALGFFRSENKEQIATLNSLGTAIDKQVSGGGLTLHIKEAIGDAHTANLLFDVIASNKKALEEFQYTFESTSIQIPGGSSMGWYIDQLPDENPHDNVIPMILCMDAAKELIGKEIELEFTNFSFYNPKFSSEDDWNIPVVKGDWKISLVLDYEDHSIRYKPNKVADAFGSREIQVMGIKIFESKAKIKEVILSPISISIKLQGFGISLSDRTPPPVDGSDSKGQDLVIYLKNGESFSNFSSSGMSTRGSAMIANYSFAEVLDLSQIDFLEYKGTKIDLSR